MSKNGMQQSLECAEKSEPGWAESTYKAFCKAARKMTAPFTAEQVRGVLSLKGIESPTDQRAFGGIVQRAHRDGVLRRTGQYAPAKSSHGSPKPLWTAND